MNAIIIVYTLTAARPFVATNDVIINQKKTLLFYSSSILFFHPLHLFKVPN